MRKCNSLMAANILCALISRISWKTVAKSLPYPRGVLRCAGLSHDVELVPEIALLIRTVAQLDALS